MRTLGPGLPGQRFQRPVRKWLFAGSYGRVRRTSAPAPARKTVSQSEFDREVREFVESGPPPKRPDSCGPLSVRRALA